MEIYGAQSGDESMRVDRKKIHTKSPNFSSINIYLVSRIVGIRLNYAAADATRVPD